MLPAAKERTPPDFPLAAPVSANVAENSHRGFATKFPTRIGASSDLSPIARLGCGHVYDKTASARLVYPNGLESQFTPDTLNRLTSLNNGKLVYDYTLDAVGNRSTVVEHLPNQSGRTVNWSYDHIYRLTDEVISLDSHSKNGNVHYDLDPVGNRTQETGTLSGLLPGSFTYDFDDRLNTETYDANGNTLTSGGKTFTYDFANRLKSMTAGSVSVAMQYDADGNRVAKTVNGVTTRYLVDDLNPTGYAQVVEEVTGATAERTYTYGLQRISQNQIVGNTWTPSFYGYDGGGTARLLTDSTGTVTDTYDYDAWGNVVNTTGTTPNAYLYRGEQYDPDLGLYYLRARYLNPSSGRFFGEDPEPGDPRDPISLHRYLYAGSNPVGNYDPTGRLVKTWQPSEYQLLTTLVIGTAVATLPLVTGAMMYNWLATNNTLTAASAAASGKSTQVTTGNQQACGGRIQAQKGTWYKSAPWAQPLPPTRAEGMGLLLVLVSQLTGTEARDLRQPIAKATTFIGITCPAAGGCPPGTNKHWYGNNGRRIDLEVWSCVAFTP
jgi:RHS repeat-associated protein